MLLISINDRNLYHKKQRELGSFFFLQQWRTALKLNITCLDFMEYAALIYIRNNHK